MFTAEYRDHVRDRILEIARSDSRLVAGAFVGSSAGEAHRWSDLDLSFGISEDVKMDNVPLLSQHWLLGKYDARPRAGKIWMFQSHIPKHKYCAGKMCESTGCSYDCGKWL